MDIVVNNHAMLGELTTMDGYGVSCVDQIPDAFVDDANDFAIAMLTKMFDKNTEMLDLIEQEYLEEENREEE